MPGMEEYLMKWRVFRRIRVVLSRIVLPGFHGVSLYDSLSFFLGEIISDRFAIAARSVSFSFLMSLPPLLLFLFTLIPYLPFSVEALIQTIEETMGAITQSESLQAKFSNLLNDFFLHKKEVLLSFSVLMTLFFSSNGMEGLMASFDRSFAGFKEPIWYIKRLWAIILTIIFNAVIILSFSLMIFQAWLFQYFGLTDWVIIGKVLQYIIIIAMLVLTLSIIYRYGPSTQSRWPMITPGSILASVLIILITVGFFYAVNNLVNYNEIYGSVGTIIIFLVWLYALSLIVLIGFELNVSIFVNKALKSRELKVE